MRLSRFLLPDESLLSLLDRAPQGIELAWLGQAGFLLRSRDRVVLIDPYLSDHLARKYKGTRFPHERMMPAPVAADALPRVDLVVCSHRHGDHMDPATLPVLAARHPRCQFVVPAPELRHALSLGLPHGRLILAEAGRRLHPLPGLSLDPIPAAHERFEQDEDGRHHFLGYVLNVGGLRLYHSGDCIPYDGLPERLRTLAPALALLPVNGRDVERAAARVPGNFTLDEAVSLCRDAAIPHMIAQHFGLFAFNSADPAAIDALAATVASPHIFRPDTRHGFCLEPS